MELIPLLSFLYLRGACRTCKTRIGYTYPFIEIASGLVFVAALYLRPVPTQALALSLALWLLLTISIIDIRTHLISDAMNIPFVLLAIIASVLAQTFDYTGIIVSVAFFGAQWLISRGKWLGEGDIILGAGIGALVGGWERMIACLFLTYIIGALIACTLLLTGAIKRGQYVAFGPFLALGAVATLFAHTRIDQFISVYLGI